jgi:hypothetical protein
MAATVEAFAILRFCSHKACLRLVYLRSTRTCWRHLRSCPRQIISIFFCQRLMAYTRSSLPKLSDLPLDRATYAVGGR